MENRLLVQETKHIRGLADVLHEIADEADNQGYFSTEHLALLKKVGSTVLFKGVTINYRVK